MTRGAFNQELKMRLRAEGRNPNGKPYKGIKQLKKGYNFPAAGSIPEEKEPKTRAQPLT